MRFAFFSLILILFSTGLCSCGPGLETESFKSKSGRIQKFVFVHPVSNGVLGGLAGADSACQSDAATSGLSGNYVAWLSTTTSINAINRLNDVGQYIALVTGVVVFESISEIKSGAAPKHFIDRFSNGTQASPVSVFTGTNNTGNYTGGGSTDTCSDWSGGTTAKAGDIYTSLSGWTNLGTLGCGTAAAIYCFEN